ncbi:ATP-binding protein [Hymenobacter aerilatus]|uniref:histidine kinase n=1 Tax=Hymenobacter aerilatus TaxID=2932251 RepID=A0A8T9SX63_9BACT|nr:ATP-binding protein [Hymenobacter aerilatus]UOR04386.1 ATP-binding protein [Hymenobacter aerilatus]
MSFSGSLKQLWLCLLLVSATGVSVARAQDSLAVQRMHRLLAILPPDTNRVRLLDSLCVQHYNNAPEQGIVYGRQALALARQLHDRRGQLMSLLSLGVCYNNLSDSQYALTLYKQAMSLARRFNSYDNIVRSYCHMASVHSARGDTATMWRLYRPALALAYHKGVQHATQIALFGDVGVLLLAMHRNQQALRYLHRALLMARRSKDVLAQAQYTANLGTYYQSIAQYATAEGLLHNAVGLAQQQHNSKVETSTLLQLSHVLLARQRPAEAEVHAARALELARAHRQFSYLLDAYGTLAKIEAARGNFAQGYAWQQRYLLLNDTINNHDRLVALAALQQRYETQDKEQQIARLTANEELQRLLNRQLIITIVILAAGLAAFTFIYLQLRRSRAALSSNHQALQETTAELQRMAASKDRLYSIVAHDLRGPVTSLAGVTKLIEFYLNNGDEAGLRRLPTLVHQTTSSINHLLDNLLSWAVNQNGELTFRPETLPVTELFAEIVELYQTTAQAKQIQLLTNVPSQLTLYADYNMTRTILRNVLSNALRFAPVGSIVRLGAYPVAGSTAVVLTCTDNGPGMPADQVATLLHPNSVAQPTHWQRREGTGLGLVLCRAFVARQHGHLRIHSAQGQGTTIEIELPSAILEPLPT